MRLSLSLIDLELIYMRFFSSSSPCRLGIWVFGFVLCLEALLQADERRFTYVYGTRTEEKGEVEYEQWITWKTASEENRDYDKFEFRHELEFGITRHLLMSFHGVPERYVALGDPYRAQCERTASLLAERLGLAPDAWSVSFQSRFGRARWLQPYTSEVLAGFPKRGVASVSVICPGFSAAGCGSTCNRSM